MNGFELRNSRGTRMAGIVVEGRTVRLRHSLSKQQLKYHLPMLYLDVYENAKKLTPDVVVGADGAVTFRDDEKAIRLRLVEKEFAIPGQPTILLTIHDVAPGALQGQPLTPSVWKVRLSLVP